MPVYPGALLFADDPLGMPRSGQFGRFSQNLVLVGLWSRQTLADHGFSIRAALLTVGDFWLMRLREARLPESCLTARFPDRN